MHAAYLFSLVPIHKKIPGDSAFCSCIRPTFDLCLAFSQAREKSTKINLLGSQTAWSGGRLPREGVGQKAHSLPPKFVPGKTKFILRMCREFCLDVRTLGLFKKLVQEKCVLIFV